MKDLKEDYPKKHHYIPQLILRNFCFDDGHHVHYYDKVKREFCDRSIHKTFMSRFLYCDEENNPDDFMRIEKDFSTFEREVSDILRKHFYEDDSVVISTEENDKVMLFFALMGLRAKRAKEFFEKISLDKKQYFYSLSQPNLDFLSLWKRNLGFLVQCRSLSEIWKHPHIDYPFKLIMVRDNFGLFGKYISVLDCCESFEFVIGDSYPTVISGIVSEGDYPLEMYTINPISPKRVIMIVDNGVEKAPKSVSRMRPSAFLAPKISPEKQVFFHVKKLYKEEVNYLNESIIQMSDEGYIVKNKGALDNY